MSNYSVSHTLELSNPSQAKDGQTFNSKVNNGAQVKEFFIPYCSTFYLIFIWKSNFEFYLNDISRTTREEIRAQHPKKVSSYTSSTTLHPTSNTGSRSLHNRHSTLQHRNHGDHWHSHPYKIFAKEKPKIPAYVFGILVAHQNLK